MKKDNEKYLLSIIALLVAILLTILYVYVPPNQTGNRYYLLFIDLIPSAIVVLIAIPIVYWLFYRRGLANMGDCPLANEIKADRKINLVNTDDNNNYMRVIPEEIAKASRNNIAQPNEETQNVQQHSSTKDILVVVDIQQDFITGSLKAHDADKIIKPLNSAIHIAESEGMIIAFTKDWHPTNHCSFETNGGAWPIHCEQGKPGSELSPELHKPVESIVIEFGVDPGKRGYSPFENSAFNALLSSPEIGIVYVTGIALEYCILATCIDAIEKCKKVVALEWLIATAGNNHDEIEDVWLKLVNKGVIREKRHDSLGKHRVNHL